MKLNRFVTVLFAVLFVAALFVVPVFAQDANPPAVQAPVFDWTVISKALETLLSALLLPLVGFAVRWFISKGNLVNEQLTQEQHYAFDTALKTFVYAAEQMKLKGFIDDKLTFVIERAEAWLIERRIEIDLIELRARIEAEVIREFPKAALPKF